MHYLEGQRLGRRPDPRPRRGTASPSRIGQLPTERPPWSKHMRRRAACRRCRSNEGQFRALAATWERRLTRPARSVKTRRWANTADSCTRWRSDVCCGAVSESKMEIPVQFHSTPVRTLETNNRTPEQGQPGHPFPVGSPKLRSLLFCCSPHSTPGRQVAQSARRRQRYFEPNPTYAQ